MCCMCVCVCVWRERKRERERERESHCISFTPTISAFNEQMFPFVYKSCIPIQKLIIYGSLHLCISVTGHYKTVKRTFSLVNISQEETMHLLDKPDTIVLCIVN